MESFIENSKTVICGKSINRILPNEDFIIFIGKMTI
jgi:hypothetical protein